MTGAYSSRSGSAVRNKATELILLVVYAMKHSGGSEKLKRATHREALVRMVLEVSAVAGVESSDTQTAAQTLFDSRESFLRSIRT